ncbi:MAG: MarR family winged helix-turn-helix transcriptional regulator [Pseudomonadota bacterium]|nr:MarR family winged helix-turn-helix transcriptional regulator [Pseudomonadota bacterium]
MGVNFPSKSSAADSSENLRRLSDEVSRIASTLAQLSIGCDADGARDSQVTGCPPKSEVSAETVKQAIRARRLRSRYLDAELFADPAWDMLLTLYHAELAQLRVPVTSLCNSAGVPPTTALRWLSTMTDTGLFTRRSDPRDGRRSFVELATETREAMRRYFLELSEG